MPDHNDVDAAIDNIIAGCDGDWRGALKALLLVNEQLERELDRVTALAIRPASPVHVIALH